MAWLWATAIQVDARQPEAILAHPEVRRLLDLGRPLAVLLVALLHFVPDDAEAERLVRVLRDAVAPGSYVVIAHATGEGIPAEVREQLARLYAGTSNPGTVRSRAEIARLFAGLELVEPGVVYAPLWRPEGPRDRFFDEPARPLNFVGVARKP